MSCGGIRALLSTTTCIPSTTSTIASGYLSRRYPVLQSEILDYPPAPPDTRRGRSPDTLLARHPPMSRIDDSMRIFSSRIVSYLHPSQEQRSRLFNSRSRISDRSVAASDTYASRCDIDLCSSSILYIPRFGVSTSCDPNNASTIVSFRMLRDDGGEISDAVVGVALRVERQQRSSFVSTILKASYPVQAS